MITKEQLLASMRHETNIIKHLAAKITPVVAMAVIGGIENFVAAAIGAILIPTADGKRVPLEVKEGDRIFFAKYAGTDIKLDGVEPNRDRGQCSLSATPQVAA